MAIDWANLDPKVVKKALKTLGFTGPDALEEAVNALGGEGLREKLVPLLDPDAKKAADTSKKVVAAAAEVKLPSGDLGKRVKVTLDNFAAVFNEYRKNDPVIVKSPEDLAKVFDKLAANVAGDAKKNSIRRNAEYLAEMSRAFADPYRARELFAKEGWTQEQIRNLLFGSKDKTGPWPPGVGKLFNDIGYSSWTGGKLIQPTTGAVKSAIDTLPRPALEAPAPTPTPTPVGAAAATEAAAATAVESTEVAGGAASAAAEAAGGAPAAAEETWLGRNVKKLRKWLGAENKTLGQYLTGGPFYGGEAVKKAPWLGKAAPSGPTTALATLGSGPGKLRMASSNMGRFLSSPLGLLALMIIPEVWARQFDPTEEMVAEASTPGPAESAIAVKAQAIRERRWLQQLAENPELKQRYLSQLQQQEAAAQPQEVPGRVSFGPG